MKYTFVLIASLFVLMASPVYAQTETPTETPTATPTLTPTNTPLVPWCTTDGVRGKNQIKCGKATSANPTPVAMIAACDGTEAITMLNMTISAADAASGNISDGTNSLRYDFSAAGTETVGIYPMCFASGAGLVLNQTTSVAVEASFCYYCK